MTSDHAGYREFVEGQGIGTCVDGSSPAEIARALRRFYDDPAGARAMGERARALAEEKYHWDAVAPTLLAAYGRLLGKELA